MRTSKNRSSKNRLKQLVRFSPPSNKLTKQKFSNCLDLRKRNLILFPKRVWILPCSKVSTWKSGSRARIFARLKDGLIESMHGDSGEKANCPSELNRMRPPEPVEKNNKH